MLLNDQQFDKVMSKQVELNNKNNDMVNLFIIVVLLSVLCFDIHGYFFFIIA